MHKTIESMGFNVYNDSFDNIELTNSPQIVSCINPIAYGISTKDSYFKDSLYYSDYLILDGVYFALSSILKRGRGIKKNSGPDSFYFFMNKMNNDEGKVFFLGSSDSVLNKMRDRARIDYPNIIIDSYSPPYRKVFSVEDNNIMVNKINNFKPDILFVGMTCPKQEKWSFQNKHRIKTSLICNVGAVFDWYAGTEKEISSFWWRYNIAWLKRTIDRPEIIKRYPNIGIFFGHLILYLFGLKKY